MSPLKRKSSNLKEISDDSSVLWKNILISLSLSVVSIILIVVGFTLTPLSKIVIDGTSVSYLVDNNIGLFAQYIKVLLSGGYFLVVPMWITISIFIVGVLGLYLASFYYLKKTIYRPYRILLSKVYWKSFSLRVG